VDSIVPLVGVRMAIYLMGAHLSEFLEILICETERIRCLASKEIWMLCMIE
jgi:hypothetical protein